MRQDNITKMILRYNSMVERKNIVNISTELINALTAIQTMTSTIKASLFLGYLNKRNLRRNNKWIQKIPIDGVIICQLGQNFEKHSFNVIVV